MASNAPITQHIREFVPPAEIYTGENPSFAGITQVVDKEYSWIGFENVLRIYDARSYNLVAEFEFFDETKSPCIVSFVTPAKVNQVPHLVVSTHNEQELSQIRLIDLRILRTQGVLVVPCNVSVLSYIDQPSESYPAGHSDLFYKFNDILAIGARTGKIMIIDLCHSGQSIQRSISPVHLASYNPNTLAANTHPYFTLNEEYQTDQGQISIYPRNTKGSEFGILFPEVTDLIPIASKQIYVSAITYIPQIRSIAVGYSIGCFQLFSVADLSAAFCSPSDRDHPERNAPISHFLYQELPDDEYGYLWVARGSVPSAKLYQQGKSYQPSILLHLMRFREDMMNTNDDDDDDIKHIKNLSHINTKEMELTKFSHHTVGRVIYCSVLSDANTNKEEYLRADASIGDSRQTRAVFVWESDGGEIHLEILDIARLEKNLEETNQSMERIMMDPTTFQSLPIQNSQDSIILNVWINPKTVMDFTPARSVGLDDNMVGGMDSASRTSVAPSFEIKLLYHDSIKQLDFLNTQQLALWELTKNGTKALHMPSECHKMCERAGLLTSAHNSPHRDDSSSQRYQLLCLALQYNIVSTVCQYVKAQVGTSEADMRFLLTNPKPIFDWAWDSYLKLSTFVNNLFFNPKKNLFQEAEMSATERAQLLWDLGEVSVRLFDLFSVFEALITRESGWSEADEETLDTLRAHQTRILTTVQKLEVLTWLVQSNVLPPTDENDFNNLFGELFAAYEGYRQDRADKYNTNNWKVSNMQGVRLVDSSANSSTLFIDVLVERVKKAVKKAEDEDPLDSEAWESPELDTYPPSDLQQLILCHKDPEILLNVRSLILYFLYDYLSFEGANSTELADSFAATSGVIPVAHRKMIRAFWILDKLSSAEYGVPTDRMADALKLLLETEPAELESWSSKIMRTFWDYSGNAVGLRFYRASFATTPAYALSLEDAVACINVLLSNGFIQEAMEFQRSFVSRCVEAGEGRPMRNKKIQYLLFHVFRHSIADTNTLQQLFQLHFNELEDQCIQHFLAYHSLTTPAPYINEVPVLVFYLLRRARHVEALACYEKLRAERPDIDTAFLATLIGGIRLTLPRVQAYPDPSRLFPYMEQASSQLLSHRKIPHSEPPLFNSFAPPELNPGEVLYIPGRHTVRAQKSRPVTKRQQTPYRPATKSHFQQHVLPTPQMTPQPIPIPSNSVFTSTPAAPRSSIFATPERSNLAPPGQTPFSKLPSLSPPQSELSPPSTPTSTSTSMFGPATPQSAFKFQPPASNSAFATASTLKASDESVFKQPPSALRVPAPAIKSSVVKRSVKFADSDEEEEEVVKPKARIMFAEPAKEEKDIVDITDDDEIMGERYEEDEEEDEEDELLDEEEELGEDDEDLGDEEDLGEDDEDEEERIGNIVEKDSYREDENEEEEEEDEGERELEEEVGREEETPKGVRFYSSDDEEEEDNKEGEIEEDKEEKYEEDEDAKEDEESDEADSFYDKGRNHSKAPTVSTPNKGYPVELDVIGSSGDEENKEEIDTSKNATSREEEEEEVDTSKVDTSRDVEDEEESMEKESEADDSKYEEEDSNMEDQSTTSDKLVKYDEEEEEEEGEEQEDKASREPEIIDIEESDEEASQDQSFYSTPNRSLVEGEDEEGEEEDEEDEEDKEDKEDEEGDEGEDEEDEKVVEEVKEEKDDEEEEKAEEDEKAKQDTIEEKTEGKEQENEEELKETAVNKQSPLPSPNLSPEQQERESEPEVESDRNEEMEGDEEDQDKSQEQFEDEPSQDQDQDQQEHDEEPQQEQPEPEPEAAKSDIKDELENESEPEVNTEMKETEEVDVESEPEGVLEPEQDFIIEIEQEDEPEVEGDTQMEVGEQETNTKDEESQESESEPQETEAGNGPAFVPSSDSEKEKKEFPDFDLNDVDFGEDLGEDLGENLGEEQTKQNGSKDKEEEKSKEDEEEEEESKEDEEEDEKQRILHEMREKEHTEHQLLEEIVKEHETSMEEEKEVEEEKKSRPLPASVRKSRSNLDLIDEESERGSEAELEPTTPSRPARRAKLIAVQNLLSSTKKGSRANLLDDSTPTSSPRKTGTPSKRGRPPKK